MTNNCRGRCKGLPIPIKSKELNMMPTNQKLDILKQCFDDLNSMSPPPTQPSQPTITECPLPGSPQSTPQPTPQQTPQPTPPPTPQSTSQPTTYDTVEALLTKQTLRICENDADIEVNEVSEYATIDCNDKLLANEECVIEISPKMKQPIKSIISAYPVFIEPTFNVDHNILNFDENSKSFKMCLKNNGNQDLKFKIHYHVQY